MTYLLLIIIYIAYVGVGLPNGILGSAWPTMHAELGVALSGAGTVSMIMSACTIIASLTAPYILRRAGTKNTAALSIALTCGGLLGFSVCGGFPAVCLCAVPYGLGAGGIDVALNDYLARRYASRHLAWMHCMWGLCASVGPYIVAYALTSGGWRLGYRYIGLIQFAVVAMLLISAPLWKEERSHKRGAEEKPAAARETGLSLLRGTPGAVTVIVMFFCYCALEKTASLWCGSFLVYSRGFTEADAAAFVSLFFIGMTVGRALSGFISYRLSDGNMVRLGGGVLITGTAVLLALHSHTGSLIGFFLVGLGCSPIYPCIIHMTPALFGAEKSQALIGTELAGAYIGSLTMPPLFGLIANRGLTGILPLYILVLAAVMLLLHEMLHRRRAAGQAL